MKKETAYSILKWAIYYALLILFYSVQTAPYAFEFFSVKPSFVLALTVCVCMFEDVMPSAVFSVFAGLLWDISSGTLFGFNGILLLLIGAATSLMFIYLLHAKLLNEVMFCTAAVLFHSACYFLFCYAVWGYKHISYIFLRYTLPSGLYTVLISIPIFFLIKKISFSVKKAQGYI